MSLSTIRTRELYSSWNYSYHLPQDKDWKLSSYKTILNNINTMRSYVSFISKLQFFINFNISSLFLSVFSQQRRGSSYSG